MSYARIEERYARLATDFGEELARKWFGNEVVDNIPRYVRGQNKGKLKGYVKWTKVTKGGWQRLGPETAQGGPNGRVLYPNQYLRKWIELPVWGSEPEIIADQQIN